MYNNESIDKPLILAFIRREAKDYTPIKGENWIARVYKQIEQIIKKGQERICIKSLGNTGCCIRSLELDTFNDKKKGKIYKRTISLCSCGKLDHIIHESVDKC